MNVFEVRDKLVRDYRSYVSSFMRIRDQRIREYVDRSLDEGLLWPDPLIQLNPSFEPGEWVDELVDEGLLHEECRRVFRKKPERRDEGKPLRLHRHQADAVRAASGGGNYVLTTGTGSGKSLAYIVPIVDHVLRHGSGRGVQAIVVYPMNALANSQHGELEKFLNHGYPDGRGPVTFERYTGQEPDEEKQRIIANPPDILLTNYVMLELIFTRPQERNLVEAARGLRYLVLDELHTYRGRQGADVALLIRRVRDRLEAENLQCVGTSATLASGGTYDEQRAEVAKVASKLFGSAVAAENVIGETLRRSSQERPLDDPAFVGELKERLTDGDREPPADYSGFVTDPLSVWIESTFGVKRAEDTDRLVRVEPRGITGDRGGARALSELTGVPEEQCATALRQGLLAGYRTENPDTGFPAFAFRLHQFISRGDTVYGSLESAPERHISVQGQRYVPGGRERVLLPLVFCRECGQEYWCTRVTWDQGSGGRIFSQRELGDRLGDEESETGFLYHSSDAPWPQDAEEAIHRLPNDWLEEQRGVTRVKRSRRDYLPRPVRVGADGREGERGINAHFIPAPFLFCLNCGISYGARQSSDFAKLTTLGAGGRSTAGTILSLSLIRSLQESDLPERARKLLSFTDNRQDASLQAGHFNDFVEVGLLRSALYRAVRDAGDEGLRHDELPQRVFDALDLPLDLYASDPEIRFQALEETQRALRNVIGYRLYRDLRRGWRITSPNLEQCGLLDIRYASLEEVCAAEDLWEECHPALVASTPEIRQRISKVLLDYMRRELAIKVSYLTQRDLEQIQQQSNQRLVEPWAMDENETPEYAAVLYPRSSRPRDYGGNVYLSARGGFGQYLRRRATLEGYGDRLTLEDTGQIISQLLDRLRIAGLVEVVVEARDDDPPGYQLPASAMRWFAGDGSRAFHDPIRTPNVPDTGRSTNPFFVEFYRNVAANGRGLQAREHTAQVPADERQRREDSFRAGRLPILYCSPTMELGVDISELNAVNMRNVPPTPANYAQRSGRAGRSGQPALVFSYCTTGSPHDQYFFKQPERMVAGIVSPPRLDLANEDLIRAHVQAVWLAETGQGLGSSLKEILDLEGENPTLAVQERVRDSLRRESPRQRTLGRARRVLETLREEIDDSDWYGEGWLEETLNQTARNFDQACDRWRDLYRAAREQAYLQNRIINDASRSAEDKKQARRLRREAEAQIDLLTETERISQSDFYSYRYFASEGFLPGYSFPRLPLSAYIPGRRGRRQEGEEYLSRSRFLAISEFGPRAFVYHEGSRYLINKVILPVGDEELLTGRVKRCGACGYVHPMSGADEGRDLCERCGTALDSTLDNLFRLQNVSTQRREKINSDEEERLRLGYEIKSGVRFAERGGHLSRITAAVERDGSDLAKLTYGHAATLWRINFGWTRRKNKNQHGFVLDTERGYWAKNDLVAEEDDTSDPMSQSKRRVIPYVDDRRNCLLFEPTVELNPGMMASLQAALKSAIQVEYQLEDSELAAEPLPERDDRRLLLFYESSEGGAGVLRQLIDDPHAMERVARRALDICHFDPRTGDDLRRARGAREDCEAACYDCLMNYANQREHAFLDRHAVRDLLLELAASNVVAAPAEIPRAEQLVRFGRQAGSDLERRWLRYLEDGGHRLPSKAQPLIEACRTRPDFLYEDQGAAIYIDGPPHDYPERKARDALQEEAMEDFGYTVIRFGHGDDWAAIIARYPFVFGPQRAHMGAPDVQRNGEDPDLDLFGEEWHPLVRSLAALEGVEVDGGSDLSAGESLMGQSVAEVTRDGLTVVVIDGRGHETEELLRLIETGGGKVVSGRPEEVEEIVRMVEEALDN